MIFCKKMILVSQFVLIFLCTYAFAEDFSRRDAVNGAVGPFDSYCDGYGNPGAGGLGYISVLKLETGIVRKDMDEVLEAIVSYDRAEAKGTYVGQINMITASSFCGLNGAVWGYHLAKDESIDNGTLQPLFKKKRSDGVEIPVYPVEPLLDAGKRLFGTNAERRFPILPGAQVKCAVKSITMEGPVSIWSAIALAIAEDDSKDANLFIEDAGKTLPAKNEQERKIVFNELMENIAESIIRCGDSNNVKYKAIFVGYKTQWVPEGYVGCALTCAPYVVLARKAIPEGKRPDTMLDMTISDWEKAVNLVIPKQK